MATRSIKDAPRHLHERSPIQSGPSPFPLLIMVLLIALIFLFKLRAEEPGSIPSATSRAALQVTGL